MDDADLYPTNAARDLIDLRDYIHNVGLSPCHPKLQAIMSVRSALERAGRQ